MQPEKRIKIKRKINAVDTIPVPSHTTASDTEWMDFIKKNVDMDDEHLKVLEYEEVEDLLILASRTVARLIRDATVDKLIQVENKHNLESSSDEKEGDDIIEDELLFKIAPDLLKKHGIIKKSQNRCIFEFQHYEK
eukprot:UN25560